MHDYNDRRYQRRRGNDANTMPTRENSGEDAGNSETTVWSFREDDVDDSSSARKKPEESVKDEIDGSTERCSGEEEDVGNHSSEMKCEKSVKDEIDGSTESCSGEHISDSSNEMKTKNSSQVQDTPVDTVPGSSEASRTGGVERTDVARVEADVASVEDGDDEAIPLEHVKPYQPKHIGKFPDSGGQGNDVASDEAVVASSEADVASVKDDSDDEEPEIVAVPLKHVARKILKDCGWEEGHAIGYRHKEKPDVKPYQPKHIRKFPDSSSQSPPKE